MDYEPKTAFEGLTLAKLEDLKNNLCVMDERLSARIDSVKEELRTMNGRQRDSEGKVVALQTEIQGIKTKSVGAGGISGGAIAVVVEVVKGLIWGK